MKYTSRINYDAMPSDNFKYVVEINDENFEAVDFISVNDDKEDTIQKELLNFINNKRIIKH